MYRFELAPTAGQIKANPFAMAAQETMVPMMTGVGSRNGIMGTADRMPAVYREGAMDALKLPSRMGEKLHYRDGRVHTVMPDAMVAESWRANSTSAGDAFRDSYEQAITKQIEAGVE